MLDLTSLEGDVALELAEFERPPLGPLELLAAWIKQAQGLRVREPLAITLATVDRAYDVSTRIVLMKALDERGLLFTTHHGSRKGRDLAEVARASATFYWRETLQQVSVAGPVERLSDREADELFRSRPRAAQATTAASEQSGTFAEDDSAAKLKGRAEALADAGASIERPAEWGGYRLLAERVEFWHGSPDRLHRRLEYRLGGAGEWTHRRLQP
ncbi:MAG: pyridoxal 5'-phosphate synthase [Solirubrobacteraceae bacterium]|nr:pyridoxal 5'-phosphate synthase [Solirubrobacteraceae bacterium]